MLTYRKRKSFSGVRLSIMMFLQFFVLGCTMPIITLYFKDRLGFSGLQIGVVMAATSLSALLSPVIGAYVADRLISAERLLSILHFIGALLLYLLSRQTEFIPVLILHLAYWLIIGPTTALTTAVTFHHAPEAVKTFGGIRLWGTLGWIAAAWVYRFFFIGKSSICGSEDIYTALQLGVWAALLLGLFAFSIPQTITTKQSPSVLLPRDSLKIIIRPKILTFSITAILIATADRMYMFGAGPYLKSLGFEERNILPVLSIGQIPEVFGMLLLGTLIIRFGMKNVFILGAILEIIRFSIFTSGATGAPLYVGISLHGLTFCFFFAAASIFIDSNCTSITRSGAHQYFALIVSGTSTLLGNLISGIAADMFRRPHTGTLDFTLFWTAPLVLSLAGLFGLLFFFKESKLNK